MFVVVLVVGVGLGALPAAAAPPMGTLGSISGHVSDANGNPLSSICVNIENGPSAPTDGAGDYLISGVAPGTYQVRYDDCSGQPIYLRQWYLGAADLGSAQSVTVTAGIDTPLSPVSLLAGATISGTVSGTNGPLNGACVDAEVPWSYGWMSLAHAMTASDGSYTLRQLPTGSVRVHFYDCPIGGPDIEEWNGDAPSFNEASPIAISIGDTLTGIDAQLAAGIPVSGTVTDVNGNPLAGINVNVSPNQDGQGSSQQTDSSGHYITGALAPGDYAVSFSDSQSPTVWAPQSWNGQLPGVEDVLTLVPGDAPVRTGIDAHLVVGATVSGTVTAVGGAPLANICAKAKVMLDDGKTDVGDATTASDGTYTLTGLPATGVMIRFDDCNDSRTHIGMWWGAASSTSSVGEAIVLAAGEHRSGIDMALAPAGRITGTVTDGSANPLQGICVEAVTDTSVGDAVDTDSNGQYSLAVADAAPYRIQFVDCSGNHHFAGEWYPGRATQAEGQTVSVQPGQTISGVDATLSVGATGSISGRVTNRHGVAMTGVCVLAFVPFHFAVPALVGSDGAYTINDLPSGTYAIGFLQCGQGDHDPSPILPDPETAGLNYQALWWHDAAFIIGGRGDQRIDPIDMGANLVSVTPGQHLTGIDQCFGCVSIAISSITSGANSLTVAFTVTQPLVVTGASGSISASAAPSVAPITYTATCTSSNGGASGTATGSASPITVTGLTAGASYTCTVVAADQISRVGMSSVSAPVVVVHSLADPTRPGAAAGAIPLQLAATGAVLSGPVVIGLANLVIGMSLISASRRRSRALAGGRPIR